MAGKKNILFVCYGNMCRSVAGKYFLERELGRLGRKDVEVDSCGIGYKDTFHVPAAILDIMSKRGIDLKGHQGKKITRELMDWADLVLLMDMEQVLYIVDNFDFQDHKVYLFKEFVLGDGGKIEDMEIKDPGGSAKYSTYERCIDEIEVLVDKLITLI